MVHKLVHIPAMLTLFIGLTLLAILAYVGDAGDAIKRAAIFRSGTETQEHQPLTADGQARLQTLVVSGVLPDLCWPNFVKHQAEIVEFYQLFNGRLPWVQAGKPTDQARAMIAILQNADLEGLSPEDYDAAKWNARFAVFQQPLQPSEWDLVRFDVALTVSTMRYVSDLHLGRVNPRFFHFEFDTQYKTIDLSEYLRQKLVDTQDVAAAIESVEPPFPAYQRTITALRRYLELARHDSGRPLPWPKKPVRPGDSYSGLPRLVELLQITGDFRLGEGQGTDGVIYTPALAEGVKLFQRRHGLDVSGLLDWQTVKQLNVPLARRVLQLQLTLERWRWAPHEFERPPIVVNIPEFRLHTNDQQYHWNLSMKVVVGKAYHHQTPVFASELRSVILRPYWNVPLEIQRDELLPQITKNSAYLAEHSYEIVDRNGNVVADTEENMNALRSGKLGIRQKPGPDNALDLIKFDFPNTYDVYMHGTPATELFSRSRRDFSHGCIRVEDPVALAAWILRDKPEWTAEHIRSAMHGDKTVRVKLDQPTPVFIVYGTAVVMEDGEVRFFDDIYGQDRILEHVLAQTHP
jgi:murein L,D-transpeptidase YcbB/YkuD